MNVAKSGNNEAASLGERGKGDAMTPKLTHLAKKLRKKSRQEVKLWPYQRLSRRLDPILLGDFRNVKLLRKLLNLLNFIFELI